MSPGDAQLVKTELLAAEVLKPGRSTREEFAMWLGELTEEELKGYLAKRKGVKEAARVEMKEFQEERKAEQERIEARRKKMQEQVKKAREERSMAFNPPRQEKWRRSRRTRNRKLAWRPWGVVHYVSLEYIFIHTFLSQIGPQWDILSVEEQSHQIMGCLICVYCFEGRILPSTIRFNCCFAIYLSLCK